MALDRNMIDYLPPVLQEVREMKALMNTEQVEFENSWTASENVLKNLFIDDMDLSGVQRWESILRITPKATESLSDRRFMITTRLIEDLPYTMKKLIQQLEKLCGEDGYTLMVDSSGYSLIIKIALTSKNQFDSVQTMVERMIPANMIVDLDLLYNQYITLALFTHATLANHTHKQLRDSIIS